MTLKLALKEKDARAPTETPPTRETRLLSRTVTTG